MGQQLVLPLHNVYILKGRILNSCDLNFFDVLRLILLFLFPSTAFLSCNLGHGLSEYVTFVVIFSQLLGLWSFGPYAYIVVLRAGCLHYDLSSRMIIYAFGNCVCLNLILRKYLLYLIPIKNSPFLYKI